MHACLAGFKTTQQPYWLQRTLQHLLTKTWIHAWIKVATQLRSLMHHMNNSTKQATSASH